MAVIETWFNQDLQKPVQVNYLDGNLFSNNSNGNRIGVVVTNNGEAVTLTGTVSGYAVLADGTTVPCTGTRSGNKASILIPPAAYLPGAIFVSVFLTDGNTVTTLAAVSSSVLRSRTDNQVDPGSVVTDWTQTINAAMQEVVDAAEGLEDIVATPYESLTFPVPLGAYTIYNQNLYRCTTPIATSEAFTAAHWSSATNVGNELQAEATARQTGDAAVLAQIAPVFAENTFYPAGQYVTQDGVVYRLTADHAIGTTWANTQKAMTNLGSGISDLNRALAICNERGYDVNLFPIDYIDGSVVRGNITFTKEGRKVHISGTQNQSTVTFSFFGSWGTTNNNFLTPGKQYLLNGIDEYTTVAFFNSSGSQLKRYYGILGGELVIDVPSGATGVAIFWQCKTNGTVISARTLLPAIYDTLLGVDKITEEVAGNLMPFPYKESSGTKTGVTLKQHGRKWFLNGTATGASTFEMIGKWGATGNLFLTPNMKYVFRGFDSYSKVAFFDSNGEDLGVTIIGTGEKVIIVPNDAVGITIYWQCGNSNVINSELSPVILLKENAVETFDATLNSSNISTFGFSSVVDLPLNRIFRFNTTIPDSFRLPVTGQNQTILKFSPYTNTNQGYCIYISAVLESTYERFFIAYSISNQDKDTLVWHELGVQNKKLKLLGISSRKIAFIGDSIVEGYGSSDYNGGESGTSGHLIPNNVKTWYRNTGSLCWANKMISYLTTNYANVTAVNNGIGGFTAQNVLDNLSTLAVDDNGNLVDIAIISIGTNNRNSGNKRTALIDPIVGIIRWCQQRGIQPIILTNTPIIGVSAPNNAETVQSCIIEACNRAGVNCYILLSTLKRYMWEHNIPLEASTDQTKFMHDYLHPADMGYEIMFELIKEMLNV